MKVEIIVTISKKDPTKRVESLGHAMAMIHAMHDTCKEIYEVCEGEIEKIEYSHKIKVE